MIQMAWFCRRLSRFSGIETACFTDQEFARVTAKIVHREIALIWLAALMKMDALELGPYND